jgi:HD-GYP domain-containing protein (c-di-GMP phosphodiesterase class II)
MSERYRDALLKAGINAVYVEDELGAGIDPQNPLSEETRREATTALANAFKEAPAALAAGQPLPDEAIDKLQGIVHKMIDDISSCDDAALALDDLASADAYTLQHSIDVAALGLLIGQKLFSEQGRVDFRGQRVFDKLDDALARLGIGLILHDIGKLSVPSEVLHKPGKLDAGEWALMRHHPVAGAEMLENSDLLSFHSRAVVRSHHERWDGSGYPDGLSGEEIAEFARIASVADVYDAITSERHYSAASPSFVGVDTIVAGSGTNFDPRIVEVFQRIVAPYPPGVEVSLLDGRRAVVVEVPTLHFERPIVRVFADESGALVDPYEVDLRSDSSVKIGEPAHAELQLAA